MMSKGGNFIASNLNKTKQNLVNIYINLYVYSKAFINCKGKYRCFQKRPAKPVFGYRVT